MLLTCDDEAEAQIVAKTLLEKKLVACAKHIPVNATYWWKGAITEGHEILLVMESVLDLYDEVEKAVAQIHSYETFVLEAVPVAKISQKAAVWMQENLKAVDDQESN